MAGWAELAGYIRDLDEGAASEAISRQAILTKPAGALGRLEDLSIKLAGITGRCPPPVPEAPR
ncbi:MAG TPA: nicotinate-nucleotide--dimethylbenzimidazole phosphoribosyltransferase, partial [Acidimicrobiales bacterium]|nr:nicotinate-nucleotide--dimethylbenzimidazole phosphoribosyltransferase [Acidimicrobiales bacterium]